MSAQINLYHPRFLKPRDWLTLANVLAAACVCYLLLLAMSAWAARTATAQEARLSTLAAQLAAVTVEVDAARAAAARQPDAQLAADVAAAAARLQRREEVARRLAGWTFQTTGFADYLRGFAHAAPQGLWLTGFSIAGNGNDMEIRGSMHDAAVLPEYIRRLGEETVFQGRGFSALTLNRVEPLTVIATTAPGGVAAVPPAPTSAAATIDFVLLPKPDAEDGKP